MGRRFDQKNGAETTCHDSRRISVESLKYLDGQKPTADIVENYPRRLMTEKVSRNAAPVDPTVVGPVSPHFPLVPTHAPED